MTTGQVGTPPWLHLSQSRVLAAITSFSYQQQWYIYTRTKLPAHEQLEEEPQSTACEGGTKRRDDGVANRKWLTSTWAQQARSIVPQGVAAVLAQRS